MLFGSLLFSPGFFRGFFVPEIHSSDSFSLSVFSAVFTAQCGYTSTSQ
ncbi:hypothetical protein EPIR_2718 [Erwinia piriflorinigrans CFBP 5888]|uniref:Uncharacterized protein n=1 Tax=Erwinia piriflorinigrans CFBP 5888 TaxID=1161919 RepID=V5ZAZ3_9GAMM|nr:hypothetical protein EPIR_2718 [Erwinia piriflorinigrans CFBP 5888]